MNNMLNSSKGIFLSILLITSVFTMFSFNQVSAQVVTVEGLGFEETSIIEFENTGENVIESIRIWLGSDNSFKSFKAEKGWIGKKNAQGVIVFTASDPLKLGETVKFGVKTEKTKPEINWKALDRNDSDLQIGKIEVTEPPTVPTTKPSQTSSNDAGILADSIFRLIPEKPNVGSSVRIVGEKFASNQKLDFYIGNNRLESFETNQDGHFMFTTTIPENQDPDRVNFVVKDKQGNEKTVSLRLGEEQSRPKGDEIRFTISGFPSVIYPGDVLLITGTANPETKTVTAKIKDPNGKVTTTNATSIDPEGKWSYTTMIPIDALLGKYSAEITDGKETITKSWTVESSQTIQIAPSKLKFDTGEAIKFNGTVLPNQNLEVILENPQGIEVFSDIIEPDNAGFVEFEFPTSQSTLEGTYVLFAAQGKNIQIVPVGLGQLPEKRIVVKLDKLNYKTSEKAILTIDGPPSSTLSLIIINPSDKEEITETITLGPDGKKTYELELLGYASGVYTAVVKRANSVTEEVFTVGLQTGSGEIKVSTTKEKYQPGDSVLILGSSSKNILLTLSLIDAEGNVIKEKETFTNKNGIIAEGNFRIPSNAEPGIWKIKATSGPNFAEDTFEVTISLDGNMLTYVDKIENHPSLGKLVYIKVLGAQGSTFIDIVDSDGEIIGHLEFGASEDGEISTPWPVPKGTPPGIYTIKVDDQHNKAEATFELE